jgi:vacuolar-type H+-ATPase subunit H
MEQERQTAAERRAELEARLAQVEEEAGAILDRAEEEARTERITLLQQTQAEVERILAGAHIEAGQVQQQATQTYHHELVETVLQTSLRMIERVAPPELHDGLVKQLNDQVWALGQNGMRQVQTIRRSLEDRAPTVSITTARPLSPEQQGLLLSTFTALADREVKLETETDPALVAGLRVRMGDTVIDHSMAGKVAELHRDVSQAMAADLPTVPISADEATVQELTPL